MDCIETFRPPGPTTKTHTLGIRKMWDQRREENVSKFFQAISFAIQVKSSVC